MNVTAATDDDGDVVERYAYDAYGARTVLNGAFDADGAVIEWTEDPQAASDYGVEIAFAGYLRDEETRLYHVRFRMYHPDMGLWINRDAEGYIDGMGLYEYVGGEPVSWLDPSGLRRRNGQFAAFGAAAFDEFSRCSTGRDRFGRGVAQGARNSYVHRAQSFTSAPARAVNAAATGFIRTAKFKPARERYGQAVQQAQSLGGGESR